ncbi:Peroxisomal membrane protein 11A [Smittium culicis]|uniref:Peroxisomal membrane protein 11A n=1 Tax=Smittium culicis TaxID=133412 RepID=A0A1R1Y1P1_9FUNG|nr:Peroxisomal membrane protein 11A [Smittium culicis]
MVFDKSANLLSDVFESKCANIYVKYAASTAGRDKAYRFIQYFSRFLVYTLNHQTALKPAASFIAALSKIQASMTETRKILRLGKFIDSFKLALAAIKNPASDELAKLLSSISKLFMGMYVICDGAGWLNSTGLIKLKNPQQLSKVSMRCWLTSIVLSFLNGLYSKYALNLRRVAIASTSSAYSSKSIAEAVDMDKETLVLIAKEKNTINSKIVAVNNQLLVDAVDMIIPVGILGLLNINNGVIGVAGMITSILGANDLISKISP